MRAWPLDDAVPAATGTSAVGVVGKKAMRPFVAGAPGAAVAPVPEPGVEGAPVDELGDRGAQLVVDLTGELPVERDDGEGSGREAEHREEGEHRCDELGAQRPRRPRPRAVPRLHETLAHGRSSTTRATEASWARIAAGVVAGRRGIRPRAIVVGSGVLVGVVVTEADALGEEVGRDRAVGVGQVRGVGQLDAGVRRPA